MRKIGIAPIRVGERLGGLLGQAADRLVDLAFPQSCVACGCGLDPEQAETGGGFCLPCRTDLKVFTTPCCPRCAAPLLAAAAGAEEQQTDCPRCRDRSWGFDGTIALGPYEGLMRYLVLAAKRSSGERGARALGGLLLREKGRQFAELTGDETRVVSVPSHWRRRLARGCNPPDALAASLASGLRLPMVHPLRRVRHTARQTELAPSRRLENVRSAFGGRGRRLPSGCTVLLVDDVLTTGSTASSAARALKRHGATKVVAVVAARGLGQA